MYERSLCVCQTVHLRACAYPQVLFCHNGCWKSSHQLMWKSAVEKGIVLELRQMLLLLAAFAFNLFFKPLEYPIYSPRLSELIFGATSIEETLLLFFFRLKGKPQRQNVASHLENITCVFLCVYLYFGIVKLQYMRVHVQPVCITGCVCMYVCVCACMLVCVCMCMLLQYRIATLEFIQQCVCVFMYFWLQS